MKKESARLSIRMPLELDNLLEEVAKREFKTKAQVIKDAIYYYFRNEQNMIQSDKKKKNFIIEE